MKSQDPTLVFDNISQRVLFSYQRQLPEFVAVLPENLIPKEQQNMHHSQKELDAFFRAFYQRAYDNPELFGLPLTEDVYVEEGDGKEEKQNVSKQIKKPRIKMAHGIDFLYFVGQHGALLDVHLQIEQEIYASFFAKSPRMKRKLVKGMQDVGLTVTEQDDAVIVGNTRYPDMMPALKALAEACLQNADNRVAKFLFARCDFRALDTDYAPNMLDMLRTALSPSEYEYAAKLHHTLIEMAYKPTLEIWGSHGWRIQYQGKRAIKATPFFEFEYDERQKRQLLMHVKCASTNRLVPLFDQQPEPLQQDFYHHANNCGAPKCSWCKTRKGMGPSALKYRGEKKTICWYMQRHFTKVDEQAADLVKHYALLHEALLAA